MSPKLSRDARWVFTFIHPETETSQTEYVLPEDGGRIQFLKGCFE
jgi:hypothetical protein